MADSSSSSDEITITVKGPSELKLSITIAPSKSVAELKAAVAEKSDVEAARQRLIYSGKVLKDEETISSYKIQTGHTIHMVKGQPKTNDPAAASTSAPQPLPSMGTGLNIGGNPLESFTAQQAQGGMPAFNPFAGMGVNMADPNAMDAIMDSPEFLRSMSEMMSRPEVIEQAISANPQLAPMAGQIREMMSNPMIRQMMSNPETLRMMMQMQRQMQQGGGGGMGGMGGMGGLPGMFGGPSGGGAGTNQAPSPSTDPFPNLFAPNAGARATDTAATGAATGAGGPGAAGAQANPFAGLFGPGGAGGAGAGAGGFNPFIFNPGMFGGGAPAAPQDTRPPEEIYATQLGQLNAMGLWDAQKNIRALRSTGGNVEAAIELIFSGQMDQQP